ncbi:nicotinate (nicotinamide) nucleotide adenylyltransferase [Bacillus carboniphilus]|uniref:Probable nicotinate-nucleotide adenylyltransferase n=1 Tax=Bacillus carboniphilus TaxID=86663 RepID=A0ABY9JSI9_9BACI|nr:nicotinate (nicotinamide) nucleotide adenylyltransferase [Bacillus carboniphilus]WLR42356.1 nicotinate (nicotinamide) nucleotide adenylyltransferase [Bacillus carboniphilus]
MAKIGIYGSSFDPITNVHLFTASTVASRCRLEKVIFLPCSSKRKDKKMNTDDEHRWNMLTMALEEEREREIVADSFEMEQDPWKITTYETMKHFKGQYPNDDVYFIMGADLLVDIGSGKWSNGEKLVEENKFIVMARDNIDMLRTISHSPILRNNDDGTTFHLIDKGLAMEISSSYIREEFSNGGEPKYLLPNSCYYYIKEHGLYED